MRNLTISILTLVLSASSIRAQESAPTAGITQAPVGSAKLVTEGPVIDVYMDGVPIFNVDDFSHNAGGVALYSYANPGSIFDNLLVEDLGSGSTLLFDDFNDGDATGWSAVDEGAKKGPSIWTVEAGELLQKSKISTKSKAADKLGTYVYYEGF